MFLELGNIANLATREPSNESFIYSESVHIKSNMNIHEEHNFDHIAILTSKETKRWEGLLGFIEENSPIY